MEISVTVSGDRDVALRLEKMPERLHQRLVAKITTLTARLRGIEESKEPHRHGTGKLKSETRSAVSETPDVVRGRVFVDAPGKEHAKAGALEYGAHGMTEVQAFARAGHTPLGAPAEQMVEAYRRRVDVMAYRFARGSLDEMRGEIDEELEAAVREEVA